MTSKRKPSTPAKPRRWEGFPLDAKGRFNGKSMKHWDAMAAELVIDCLIRASMVDTRSVVGHKASKRLLEIAQAENPDLFLQILDERARCQVGFQAVLAAIL